MDIQRPPVTFHRTWISTECEDRPLQVTERLGYLWTTLGRPEGPPQSLLGYDEIDRIVMNIWSTPLECSGLRMVDDAIDNEHLPSMHPGNLGDQVYIKQKTSKPFVDEAGTLWSPPHKA